MSAYVRAYAGAYVLDASVGIKWFLPSAGEPLAAEARRILDEFTKGRVRLCVPDLFWPEVGKVLWKAVLRGRISFESAEETVHLFADLNLPTIASAPLLPDALAIAGRFDRTVYDAIYVALAVTSGRPLMTADERLANALAAYLPVVWLGGRITA